MARNSLPFLLRRGDTFAFRLRVPQHLRPVLGCREIVRSLKTQNKQEAAPLALVWAGKVKTIFAACESMTRPITASTLKRLLTAKDSTKPISDLIAALEHSKPEDLKLAETSLTEAEETQYAALLDKATAAEFNQIAELLAPDEQQQHPTPQHPLVGKSIGELKSYYRGKIAQEEEQARQTDREQREAARNKIRKVIHQQTAKIEALQHTNRELAGVCQSSCRVTSRSDLN